MGLKKNLFEFVVVFCVSLLIASFIICFQANLMYTIYNISSVAGPYPVAVIYSFFEQTLNSTKFLAVVFLVSSISSLLIVRRVKDGLKRKRLLILFTLLFLPAYFLSSSVLNWCNGSASITCAFLFFPTILVGTVVGLFSGTWITVIIHKLYGFKIVIPLLVIVIAINIGISIWIHREKIEEVKQTLAVGQEVASHLGHIYKLDPREYEIFREIVSKPRGEDICVIYSDLSTCFLTAGKYWILKTQVSSKRFPVPESLEIYQLEPRNFEVDDFIFSQNMNTLISDSEMCKNKLVHKEVINVNSSEKTIYGIIKPENRKCGFETHFILIYKKNATIGIQVEHDMENKEVTLQDLLKVARDFK